MRKTGVRYVFPDFMSEGGRVAVHERACRGVLRLAAKDGQRLIYSSLRITEKPLPLMAATEVRIVALTEEA